MQIYEIIERLCQDAGISINQMCKETGVSRAILSDIKMGRQNGLSLRNAKRVADYFSVDVAYLMGESSANMYRIPVYGEIAAGLPILAEQVIIDYESIPAEMARSGEYFALQVKGNSMEPRMYSGDVVILRKTEEFVSGSVCAVMVNGEEATLKKVIVRQNGITLIPLNPAYNPLNFDKEQIKNLPVRCFGVAVEVRGKL